MEIHYDEFGTSVILRKDDGTEIDVLKMHTALEQARQSREFNRGQVDVLTDRLERIDAILRENGSTGEPMYTGEQVAEFQASEAKLVAGPLQQRIAELEGQRATLTFQVRDYDTERRTERDRADKAERLLAAAQSDMHGPNGLYPRIQALTGTNAELRELLKARDEALDQAADDLAKSQEIVRQLKQMDLNLRQQLASAEGRADTLSQRNADLEASLEQRNRQADVTTIRSLETRITELESALGGAMNEVTELRRRPSERDWEAVRSLRDSLAKSTVNAERKLTAEQARTAKAAEILTARTVVEARDQVVTSKGATLADAIRDALEALA